MPDDMPTKTTEKDDERELLEEAVRQGEARLTALAQARQMTATKATTVMSWMLTILLALTTALVSINSGSRLAGMKLPLSALCFGALMGTLGSVMAVITNLWPGGLGGTWHHAGSNPRHFIPGIPTTPKPTYLGQRVIGYLRERFSGSRPSQTAPSIVQPAELPLTKTTALRDTAARYARAIDENERNLADIGLGIGASLGMVILVVVVVLITLPLLGEASAPLFPPQPQLPPTTTTPAKPQTSLPPPTPPSRTPSSATEPNKAPAIRTP